jgi:hypothetical protein
MEALYETPFFWFNGDKDYKSIAMKHRGDFAEEFSSEALKRVFGKDNVFLNVDIYDSKKAKAGEIDVLVVFADRAIVLQAKSKKLTINSRKGNDNSLKDDFKKAIQDAYDQAFLCAKLLSETSHKLIDSRGNELDIGREYKDIYLFCVVSDRYPALAFQSKQFLRVQESEIIRYPFVMDIFLVDVMTEMLQLPLHFLNYVNRRVRYDEKILSANELAILSYHLKYNLWLEEQNEMIHISDEVSADLDVAMLSRRCNIPGLDTPEGILTNYRNTPFEQIIRDINNLEYPAAIDLGFVLLSLSGETVASINNGIFKLRELGRNDARSHNMTLVISDTGEGLTIHCNDDHESVAMTQLEKHCKDRKYLGKANIWFGICIGLTVPTLRFLVKQEYEWIQSNEMDEVVKYLPKL